MDLCKRLRIMKGSEAIGLGIFQSHKSLDCSILCAGYCCYVQRINEHVCVLALLNSQRQEQCRSAGTGAEGRLYVDGEVSKHRFATNFIDGLSAESTNRTIPGIDRLEGSSSMILSFFFFFLLLLMCKISM